MITARLTDVIREELGESYSPFAAVELTGGATPLAETFLSVSTGPDRVDDVSAAVLESGGRPARQAASRTVEYAAAISTVGNELELFSNEQLNDEILDVLTDPAGNASLADFENQAALIDEHQPEATWTTRSIGGCAAD